MILYEVTLQVEPTIAGAIEHYMTSKHIPAIFATSSFRRLRFDRASPARFRTCYQADSQADLDGYLRDHAPTFRAEFQADFPQGVRVTREVWTQREIWE
jgi:hypothetical protein